MDSELISYQENTTLSIREQTKVLNPKSEQSKKFYPDLKKPTRGT